MDEETYTAAALRGMGFDEETYTDAALRGCGCDCDDKIYTTAALRGMGSPKRLKKGSPEAKAYMARLRAMRGSAGKKKLKGGIAVSTILAALGFVPTVIRGIRSVADWVRSRRNPSGGYAITKAPNKRDSYVAWSRGGYALFEPGAGDSAKAAFIKDLKDRLARNEITPNQKRARMPYKDLKMAKYYALRDKRLKLLQKRYPGVWAEMKTKPEYFELMKQATIDREHFANIREKLGMSAKPRKKGTSTTKRSTTKKSTRKKSEPEISVVKRKNVPAYTVIDSDDDSDDDNGNDAPPGPPLVF